MKSTPTVFALHLLFVFLLFPSCKQATQEAESNTQTPEATAPEGNALFVIRPYYYNDTWVFDDADKELRKEPFVAGIPEILDVLVADIPNAKEGFRLTFSPTPFPGQELVATRGNAESGGYWYHIEGTQKSGWLCPAMFKYFPEAPEKIYAKADAIASP